MAAKAGSGRAIPARLLIRVAAFTCRPGTELSTLALGGRDYSDSVLQLSLEGSSLVVRDYFMPHDQVQLSDGDADVGSSGPLLLPDQPGLHRHMLLQPTKGFNIYVIDRDRMGKFQPDRDAIVQRIRMTGGGYGAIAFWNQHVFLRAATILREITPSRTVS
jgi:hypothetical protein